MKPISSSCLPALLAMTVACATAPPAPPKLPSTPEEPQVTEDFVAVGDGVRISYSVLGDEGPAVLVPLGRIAGDLQPIADAGFRVVLIDPRGRGLSTAVTEGVPISIETDISDLDAVRQAIGEDRVHLIGMSYYGALVALYAAAHPEHVDRIVMLGPMAPTAELFADRDTVDHSSHPDYVEVERMRREGIHESDPVTFCRMYYKAHSQALYADPSRFDESALDYCELENEWPDNFLKWADTLFASIGTWDFTDEAAKVRAPALVVQGRQDEVTPPGGASAWTEAMKNHAELVWMDDCGHVPMKETPEKTRALVLEFLQE